MTLVLGDNFIALNTFIHTFKQRTIFVLMLIKNNWHTLKKTTYLVLIITDYTPLSFT